jgi:trans-2,3-dihydro-3-hydroxyanthranilate isomerase
MSTYALMQVDAFTRQPLAGNPCAVIFDADDLDEGRMLAVAREMNLSETAFLLKSDRADFRARYFTPAEEIPLAGHPTVAAAHALLESGRLAGDAASTTFSLELEAGVIRVQVRAGGRRSSDVTMVQLAPEFLNTYRPEEVMPAFGLRPEDARAGAPLQTVSTGTPQLMVPVVDLAALRRARLDVQAYLHLKSGADFFSPHLFCLGGIRPDAATFARHFGIPPDTPEDPFTGSATGGMGAYLWHYGLIETPSFVAEQGHWMGRPGRARVEIEGERDQITAVRVSGSAVTVFVGELRVPAAE